MKITNVKFILVVKPISGLPLNTNLVTGISKFHNYTQVFIINKYYILIFLTKSAQKL